MCVLPVFLTSGGGVETSGGGVETSGEGLGGTGGHRYEGETLVTEGSYVVTFTGRVRGVFTTSVGVYKRDYKVFAVGVTDGRTLVFGRVEKGPVGVDKSYLLVSGVGVTREQDPVSLQANKFEIYKEDHSVYVVEVPNR